MKKSIRWRALREPLAHSHKGVQPTARRLNPAVQPRQRNRAYLQQLSGGRVARLESFIMSKNKALKVSNDTKSVELKLKLAKPYLEEFYGLKNEEDAILWLNSVPSGIIKILLVLIALNRVQN